MDPHTQILETIPRISENPERLDEQHIFTVKTLGFLIHPNVLLSSRNARIADVGTGSGVWLLDVARTLPPSCQLTGFDASPSAFPSFKTLPPNVSFKVQDMLQRFPTSELGVYDMVAVRFVSSATTRSEWAAAVRNLMTLLKPGGWLQWIDSCNFTLYNTVAGTSRIACQSLYDSLDQIRAKDDLVIGMMMRETGHARREEILWETGLINVHEDVFSTDRVQDPGLRFRDKGTRNAINCFVGCLEELLAAKKTTKTWTKETINAVKQDAMREIDNGVYHTLDQICIVGQKP